ncbi:penicillin-binding transpeptidase domain-containing protein [Aquiflexum sp.]|uniref:penicillin-binding transpeptidase domain-containing protein n=1 Tax=Aquiflexum sp. TaxID=1872584 RepID=UPI0035943C4F
MNPLPFLFFFILSCTTKPAETHTQATQENPQKVLKPEFKALLDAANLNGSILIFDSQTKTFYTNDFAWSEKGQLPASTFKIPNAIIALETGVVENDSVLLEWHGEKRVFEVWEQDLIFRKAFQVSCVPCFQEIARNIGGERMNAYLDKLGYGGTIQVDSVTIDNFWLHGESRINQFEQIDFLSRFYQSELPISQRTEALMKNIMVIEDKGTYKISGKTGWTYSDERNNGWFVGYIESEDKVHFFATNFEPKDNSNIEAFNAARKDLTYEGLRVLGILK